jgi:myo-inositol 2-dehydrogenase/D-chiro-inositol 1-dehydrogenase
MTPPLGEKVRLMAKKYRIGIIGFGRMGRGFAAAMLANPVWDVAVICDIHPASRAEAQQLVPHARIVADPEEVLKDKSLPVVGLFTLADARPAMVKRALAEKKHILAEKPLASDVKTEWELVQAIEQSGRLVAVNMFNRNAWYHKEIQQYIAEGEIGDLAIVRVCHMTPGHMPTEGHEPEGPPFHDCGMHYVDVARWYANSEFKTWHAQGIRMWNYQDPWWVQVHGTFQNGVVFDITQGFVYGHLAKDKTHNCYVDCIGTKGIARMRHNFKDATIEVHGVTRTITRTAPFNDKKLDVMVDIFARSLIAGKNLGFPTPRDSVIASEVAWAMLNDAVSHSPPAVGNLGELEEILANRRNLRTGYGLPLRHTDADVQAMGHIEQARACGEDLCTPPLPTAPRIVGEACA